jgi:4-diphosphocytidyl-2-C-methyl-D-erythritol kinase
MASSSRELRVPAFAKLNLTLLVLYRRPDGYHEVRTILQSISLADTIHIHFGRARDTDFTLSSSVEIPGCTEDNLVVRAARLFLESEKLTARIRFHIDKRIPIGAGLGGGSSDAAATLRALAELSGRPLSPARLRDMAGTLGSDVPFFLDGGTALGISRGEEIYPLRSLRAPYVLLLLPSVPVGTAGAYRVLGRGTASELTSSQLLHKIEKFQLFAGAVECADPDGWWNWSENDFEAVVLQQHPRLARLLRLLRRWGARPARMTGSGSALYGVFHSPAERDAARRQLAGSDPGLRLETVRFLTRDQYRAAWEKALRPLQ